VAACPSRENARYLRVLSVSLVGVMAKRYLDSEDRGEGEGTESGERLAL